MSQKRKHAKVCAHILQNFTWIYSDKYLLIQVCQSQRKGNFWKNLIQEKKNQIGGIRAAIDTIRNCLDTSNFTAGDRKFWEKSDLLNWPLWPLGDTLILLQCIRPNCYASN